MMDQEWKQKIKSGALTFLRENKVAVLSTTTNNEPHAAAIYYIIDDEFKLYFVTDPESRKAKDIKSNSKVAIVVGAGPEISTIQGGGEAIEDVPKTVEILNEISAKLNPNESHHWPIMKLNHKSLVCFRVEFSWLNWLNMDLTGLSAGTYKEGFQQVLP